LIAAMGNTANFLVLAGLYVLVYLLLVPMRLAPEKSASGVGSAAAVAADFAEGWRYLQKDSLLSVVILMGISSVLFMQPSQVMPAVAEDVLGGGPVLVGMMQSALAVGGILASVGIASFKMMQRRGVWLMGSIFPQSLVLLLFSQSSTIWLSLATLVALGFF